MRLETGNDPRLLGEAHREQQEEGQEGQPGAAGARASCPAPVGRGREEEAGVVRREDQSGFGSAQCCIHTHNVFFQLEKLLEYCLGKGVDVHTQAQAHGDRSLLWMWRNGTRFGTGRI